MAAPKGHPRYGGRTKGTSNRRTVAFRAEVSESGLTPLQYMVSVMRDPNADPDRRDRMAAAGAPFIHPRLAVSAVSVHERKFSDMTEEERKREIERLVAQARQVIAEARAEEGVIEGEAIEITPAAGSAAATRSRQ